MMRKPHYKECPRVFSRAGLSVWAGFFSEVSLSPKTLLSIQSCRSVFMSVGLGSAFGSFDARTQPYRPLSMSVGLEVILGHLEPASRSLDLALCLSASGLVPWFGLRLVIQCGSCIGLSSQV